MSKHRTPHPMPGAPKRKAALRLHAMLLAALAALCVARPLLPSEGVGWQGDGQPFNMLWLSLAVVTCLSAAGRGGLPARPAPTDLAVLALWVCYGGSALYAVSHSSPRPAVNMLWEWTSLVLVYFLTRQLVRTPRQARALVAVAIALAVVLAADGYYQYFVSMPADRSQYAADPDAMLRQSGQWFAPGSAERHAFENRLASTEPLATFALANSLAGYLAPWLLVCIGAAAAGWTARESSDRRARRVLLLSALAIGGCLILTKSRSAWAALAGGLVLLPACMPELRRRLDWRVAAMLAGSLALLVAGAVAVRGLDRQVVSEAGKSLGYRLEYWQATWQMIREHPWLGCGPGNFQDAYMRYKLAVASEEIQDPHNLFFEVWGSAGTPALLALLAVLGCFAWQTWRRTTPDIASGDTGADDLASAAALPLGAAAGVILAYFVGPLMGFQLGGPDALIGVVLGGLVVAGIWPWVRRGRLPGLLLPLALLVLVVHLSAAGGISIPGVAYSFWLLLALGVNQSMGVQPLAVAPMHTVPQSRIAEAPSRTPWGAIVAMALAGAGAAACYVSAYQPVLRATAALYQAQTSEQRQDWRQYEQALLEASQADPLQSQSWPLLAALDFQRLVAHGRVAASPNEETRLQFDRALRMMLRLRPQSSAMYRQAGEWLLELYQRSGNPDDARRAVDYYRRAVELYPNSALAHGELALVLAATGDRHAAQPEIERARQLDAAMPHPDKKLPVDVQRQLEAIVEPAARSQAAGPQKDAPQSPRIDPRSPPNEGASGPDSSAAPAADSR